MAGIKITNFLGIAPKISPELLGPQFAQTAVNLNAYSGDLIPYRGPKEVDSTGRTSGVQTIYPMRNPANQTLNKWLSWTSDVDIAINTTLDEEEQRIYYTGDGVPKVTDYSLAVGTSGGPYPVASYDLGLPLPTAKPTSSASAFSEKTSASISRDGNNVATMTTSAAHGLTTGDKVNVSQLTNRTGTYARAAGASIVTVTLTAHGYETGALLYLTFGASVSASYNLAPQSGTYAITVTTANAFTIVDYTNNAVLSGLDAYIGLYDFNASNVDVTVTGATTFTYQSVGAKTSTIAATTAKINLAGTSQSRKYVYTWLTPWGEESIPSEPSNALYIKEGQVVTVGSLPTAKPTGNNFVRGFRLYRTVVSASQGTNYFRLKTVYFPNTMAFASRTSNVVTAKFTFPHNLIVNDKLKITGVAFGGTPDASFNVTDVSVASVVDKYTITYPAVGTDKATTATTAGTLYWNITEPGKTTYQYYESTTFIDDFRVTGLVYTLDTLYSDAPDVNMKGLTMAHNNIMIGFVQNELCFSEPSRPWAWPVKYRLVFEYPIVAVAASGGQILVMTTEYPYVVNGSTPELMSSSRVDVPLPCTSKRGVVNMGYGVLYPTYGGLALFSSETGAVLATKSIHDWETWVAAYDPTTMVAEFYNGKYFCSHSTGSFIYERDDQVGGVFVTLPTKFNSTYYDGRVDKFYYTTSDSGTVLEWNAADQPLLSVEWKSKVFIGKDFLNIGAARVVADFSADAEEAAAYNAGVVAHNVAVWALIPDLGTLNGQLSYTDPVTSTYVQIDNSIGYSLVNGDTQTNYLLPLIGSYTINFRLWANKLLVADVTVTDSDVFRLPAGYKSDTFEVAVNGSARIRAIHLAETPQGLVNI